MNAFIDEHRARLEPRTNLLRMGDRLRYPDVFRAGAVCDASTDDQQQEGADECAGDLELDWRQPVIDGHAARRMLRGGDQRAQPQCDKCRRRVQRDRRQQVVSDEFARAPRVAEQTDRTDQQDENRGEPRQRAQPRHRKNGQRDPDGRERERTVGRHAAGDGRISLCGVAEQGLVDAQPPAECILGDGGQPQCRHQQRANDGQSHECRSRSDSGEPQTRAGEDQSDRRGGLHFHRAGHDALEAGNVQHPTREAHHSNQNCQRSG